MAVTLEHLPSPPKCSLHPAGGHGGASPGRGPASPKHPVCGLSPREEERKPWGSENIRPAPSPKSSPLWPQWLPPPPPPQPPTPPDYSSSRTQARSPAPGDGKGADAAAGRGEPGAAPRGRPRRSPGQRRPVLPADSHAAEPAAAECACRAGRPPPHLSAPPPPPGPGKVTWPLISARPARRARTRRPERPPGCGRPRTKPH